MRRVLLIRLTALGDVVLVEPVARALRQTHPGVVVELVTEARYQPLMAEAAGFDRVIGYDRRGADAGLGGVSAVLTRIGPEGYDLVIDLQGKLRTRLLARRVRADRRLVIKKRDLAGVARAMLGADRPIHDRHAIEIYLDVLAPLGLPPVFLDPSGPQLSLRVAHARSEGVGPRIGLAVGTTHPTKRWPLERFAQLSEALSVVHPGARFCLIGGLEDRDALDQLRRAIPEERRDPLDVSALDVARLAETIGSLDLLVSVDSGPAHLASALGTPVVVLFGPTSWIRWGPRSGPRRVISLELECAPCSNIGGERCPLPDHSHRCMQELEVAQVCRAALELLEERR